MQYEIYCSYFVRHTIYWCNLCYSLLVEGLFHYKAHFIITFFLLGSHHEHYNEAAVYSVMFGMLVIVDCTCHAISHQCISLVASVNSVNIISVIMNISSFKLRLQCLCLGIRMQMPDICKESYQH